MDTKKFPNDFRDVKINELSEVMLTCSATKRVGKNSLAKIFDEVLNVVIPITEEEKYNLSVGTLSKIESYMSKDRCAFICNQYLYNNDLIHIAQKGYDPMVVKYVPLYKRDDYIDEYENVTEFYSLVGYMYCCLDYQFRNDNIQFKYFFVSPSQDENISGQYAMRYEGEYFRVK